MAKTSKIGILILAIIAAILLFLNSKEDSDAGGIAFFLFLMLLGVIVFIVILISDTRKIKMTKSMQSFNPTIIGAIIMGSTIYSLDHMNQTNKIPILIHAGYSPGVGASVLELRTDNSYEYFNGALLSSHTKHGTFTIKDNVIILDGKDVANALISNKLLIMSRENVICQIDSNGNRIENSIQFFINVDNRKK